MAEVVALKLYNLFTSCVAYLPPALLLSVAASNIGDGKFFKAYRDEFIGTMMMIAFTFSAGKWFGKDEVYIAWAFHAVGVVAADYFGGGQQVNPAVTVSMWSLGKCSYTEAFVRVSGQMGGGLISFPLFHAVSETLKLSPFGGPEFQSSGEPIEAALSEFFATFLLMWVIYILNWELNFGKHHYIIKQFLTAAAIRFLIEFFPTAGPAMNPMLATAWATFGVGGSYEMPDDQQHYFVYWVSPCIAALLASLTYVMYAGGTLFGEKVPVGPIKGAGKKVKRS